MAGFPEQGKQDEKPQSQSVISCKAEDRAGAPGGLSKDGGADQSGS